MFVVLSPCVRNDDGSSVCLIKTQKICQSLLRVSSIKLMPSLPAGVAELVIDFIRRAAVLTYPICNRAEWLMSVAFIYEALHIEKNRNKFAFKNELSAFTCER
jgi:hypothetical protein